MNITKLFYISPLILMILSLGATKAATKEESSNMPNKEIIDQKIPLSPDEIRYLKKEMNKRQKAAFSHPNPSKPVMRTIMVDLSPGAPLEIVRLSERNGASLIFTDSTGAPWPIYGDPNNFAPDFFTITVPIKDGSVVNINTVKPYGQGNVAIFLKDLPTPIILSMLAGQPETDYRLDMRLPKPGPNAKPEIVDAAQAPSFDPYLIDFLSNLPPKGALRLNIDIDNTGSAGNSEVWQFQKKFYLRTPHSLVSPAFKGTLRSQDGTTAYSLNPTPVFLLSIKGKTKTVRVDL